MGGIRVAIKNGVMMFTVKHSSRVPSPTTQTSRTSFLVGPRCVHSSGAQLQQVLKWKHGHSAPLSHASRIMADVGVSSGIINPGHGAEPCIEGFPPSASGVVVVRAGVDDLVGLNPVGMVRVGRISVKAELKHRHALKVELRRRLTTSAGMMPRSSARMR